MVNEDSVKNGKVRSSSPVSLNPPASSNGQGQPGSESSEDEREGIISQLVYLRDRVGSYIQQF